MKTENICVRFTLNLSEKASAMLYAQIIYKFTHIKIRSFCIKYV